MKAIYATGTVEAEVMLPIATRGSARLAQLNVDEGAEVKKSQVLATLESEDLKSSLDAARSREAFAKTQYERAAALLAKQATSQQAFDKAKGDWEVAKADTAAAMAQSNFMNLIAPSDGIVIRRDGEIGQLIPANQAVFWLAASTPLRITAEVDEEDIALVKTGQAVVVRADAFPGQVFNAKVHSITPKGDPISRSYRIRISLNEDTPLRIGMTAETNIIVSERQNALLIPATSVKAGEVWIVKDSKLEQRKVSIGAAGPTQVEVLEGMTAQDFIVINPDPKFDNGAKVRFKFVPQGD